MALLNTSTRRPFLHSIELKISLVLGLLVALFFHFGGFNGLENWTIDKRFVLRGERKGWPGLVLVAIDDFSIKKIGSLPWPRSTHKQLLETLKKAGAKVVAFNILFPDPSIRGENDDQQFASAIASSGNVILSVVRKEKNTLNPETCEVVTSIFADGSLPMLRKSACDEGFINLEITRLSQDGVLRNLFLKSDINGRSYGFLGLVIASRLLGREIDLDAVPLYTHRTQFNGAPVNSYLLNYAGSTNCFDEIPYFDVLKADFSPDLFKDRAVIVSLRESENGILTPFGLMNGMEIHAHLVENLVSKQFLRRLSTPLFSAVLFTLAILLGSFLYRWRGWVANIAIIPGAPLAWSLSALAAFHFNLVVEIVPVVALILVQVVFVRLYQLFVGMRQAMIDQAFTQGVFSKYLSPVVAQQMIENPGLVKLGGDDREITTLFCDIANFTTLSEKLPPPQLIQLLNGFLGATSKEIFNCQGTLDKYIGDAIMAFWNAPIDIPDHAKLACQAALAMHQKAAEFNHVQAIAPTIHLRCRIGINTGRAIVGNAGSEERFSYTAIGDSVNTASRYEGLGKLYGVSTIIGEATFRLVKNQFDIRLLDKVRVKGKAESACVYELMGPIGTVSQDQLSLHEKAMAAYFSRSWEDAGKLFREKAEKLGDQHAVVFLKRLDELQRNPQLLAEFDCVWIVREK